MDDLVQKIARDIAEENGDTYDAIPKNKADWVKRGHPGDINDLRQSDYDDMARAAIAAVYDDLAEPSEKRSELLEYFGNYYNARYNLPPGEPSGAEALGEIVDAMLAAKRKEALGDG